MSKPNKCHPIIEQRYQYYVARCPACGWEGAYQHSTADAIRDYATDHAPPVCECGHLRASHLLPPTATFTTRCRECGCVRFEDAR